MHRTPAPRSLTGFTLIELLVVIAMIALLAALAVPATSAALERGRATRCLSNLRQWGTGLMLALQQSPTQSFPTEGTQGPFVQYNEDTAWFNLIPALLEEPTLRELRDAQGPMPRPRDGSLWSCPSDSPKRAAAYKATTPFFGFGYNLWIDETARTSRLQEAGLLSPGQEAPDPVLLRAFHIEHPSRFVVFGEIADGRYATLNLAFLGYRHGHGKNTHLVFADGSARALPRALVGLRSDMPHYLTLNPGGVIWCPGGTDTTL